MAMSMRIERQPRELPMLFSAPMVRALLSGQKTVTRRIIPEPKTAKLHGRHSLPDRHFFDRGLGDGVYLHWFYGGGDLGDDACAVRVMSRWNVGDRLWVKETWRTVASLDALSPTRMAKKCTDAGYRPPWAPLEYDADGERVNWRDVEEFRHEAAGKTRVSIHMPRWTSRITLDVVDVRAERLQAITEDDAEREGVAKTNGHAELGALIGRGPSFREGFAQIWREINGVGSWESNPFVWRVEFRRVKP